MSEEEFQDLALLDDQAKDFLKFHGSQLISNGFPLTAQTVTSLLTKLRSQTYDAGQFFQILADENDDCYRLQALQEMPKNQEAFLVDHFFSFRYSELRKQLQPDSKKDVRKRLNKMLKFWKTKTATRDLKVLPESVNDPKLHPEFDYQDISDPNTLDIDWPNVITLSLFGCKIENADLIAVMLPKLPKLKALWVNGNPCCAEEQFSKMLRVFVEEHHKGIEIFNSKFTKHTQEWGLKFATFGGNLKMVETGNLGEIETLDISDREFNNMQNKEVLATLTNCKKVYAKDTYFNSYADANRFLEMIRGMSNLVHLEMDYYMLDLFWKIKESIKKLNPGLKYINGYDLGYAQPKEQDETLDNIISNIWKVADSYRVGTGAGLVDTSPIFYVADEVGCAIRHSDTPNTRMFPFIYYPENKIGETCVTLNIFWNVEDLKQGDYLESDQVNVRPENERQARRSLFESLELGPLAQALKERQLAEQAALQKGQEVIDAHLAKESNKLEAVQEVSLKIYTTDEDLISELRDPRFKIAASLEEADVNWMSNDSEIVHSEDSASAQQSKYNNKLPSDGELINSKKLASTVLSMIGSPDWMPRSYNMQTEFSQFLGEYLENRTFASRNFWLAKPEDAEDQKNLAISSDLDALIRLGETSPFVITKYMENPLRFRGAKFIFRFFVLIRSVEPLEVYIHDLFFVNLARNDFTLDKRRLFQYDTHFAESNPSLKDQRISDSSEFIKEFETKHKKQFSEVRSRIHNVIRDAIILSKEAHPELQSSQTRGFYAADALIDTDFNPKLYQFSFSPDGSQAADLRSTFWSEVFGCLFYGDEKAVTRVV